MDKLDEQEPSQGPAVNTSVALDKSLENLEKSKEKFGKEKENA